MNIIIKIKKKLSEIPKNVFLLGFVSFFNDVSSEMIYPLLPLFMTNILGINTAIIGLIEGFAESISSILKAPAGYLSDKINKRKPFVLFGYSISCLTKPLFAVATIWQHVLVFRALDRTGKGIRTSPRDALLADSTKKRILGKSFGLQRALDTFGAIVGPLIASILISYFAFTYTDIFLVSFIPALIGVLLVFFFVREIVPKKKIKHHHRLSFSKDVLKGPAMPFILISAIFAISNFSSAFLFLRANQLGIAIALVPLVYLLSNIINSLFSIPIGIISDKFGRKKIIAIGYILFSVMCFVFAFEITPLSVVGLFVVYGLVYAIIETVPKAYLADITSPKMRGSTFGMYYLMIGLAALPSSLIIGILWNYIGIQIAFIFSSTVAMIATIGLIICK